MFKKSIYLCLALVATSIMFSACSKVSTKQESTTKVETQDKKEEQVSNDNTQDNTENVHLLVYAGAGLKKAMEDIKTTYEKENPNIVLDITYAGSGKLLAQLEASKKGDLFIVGAKKDYDKALEENLVKDGEAIADHTPTLIVKKGNPLGIESLKDLEKDGVRVIIADPKAAPIGDRAMKIFANAGLKDIEKNIVNKVENLPAVVTGVDTGNADVGVATLDSVFENDNVEKILIPDDINVGMVITGGVCTTTEHEKEADAFKDFLVSSDGRQILKNHGFYYLEKNEK